MKVKFVPQNVECEIKPGQSVMHVAQDNGLYIKSVCKGVPSCAECRVRIIDGEHNVLPPGTEELALIGTGHFIDRRRLSCQLKCFGDITVDLSEQIAKEQGLIGGRKTKRHVVKDDRVEEAVARRSEDTGDTEPLHSGDAPTQNQVPAKQREQRRDGRDHRKGDRSSFQANPENKRHGERPPPREEQGPDRNPKQAQGQGQGPQGQGQGPGGAGKRRRRSRGKGGGGGGGKPGGNSGGSGPKPQS